MKLISAYIQGFGGLSGREITFDPALTCFCRNNGAGKTTLASFLKAMLYGLPGCRANSKIYEDRRKFCPYGGGSFGGSLKIEADGKRYEICRSFDPRTDTRDTLTVYCGGRETGELGEVPGITLFGLEESSFARTAFFTGGPMEAVTSDISAKLSPFVYDGGDYASAKAALETAAKAIRPLRGQNGELPQLARKIGELEREVRNLQDMGRILEEKYEKQRLLQAGIQKDHTAISQARSLALAQERWTTYQSLLAQSRAYGEKLQALRSRYPQGIPDEDARSALGHCRDTLAGAAGVLKGSWLPLERQDREQAILSRYPKGLPGPEGAQTLARLESKKSPWLLWALWGLLLAGGTAACFYPAPGLLLMAAALTGLGVRWLMGRKNRRAKARLLENWHLPRDITAGMMEADREALSELHKERENLNALRYAAHQRSVRARAEAEAALAAYSLPMPEDLPSALAAMEADGRQWESLEALCRQAWEQAESYRRQHGLNQPPQAPEATVTPEELEKKRQALAVLTRQIGEMEYSLERLPEAEQALAQAMESRRELEERLAMLRGAMDCLAQAEEALKARFVHPVQKRLEFYMAQVEGALGEKAEMTQDFKVNFREQGMPRRSDHLSGGEQIAVDLCLRLALLDVMYPRERPFLILDDPFSALDEAHFAKAAELLAVLSQTTQILYFTCHPSRTLPPHAPVGAGIPPKASLV